MIEPNSELIIDFELVRNNIQERMKNESFIEFTSLFNATEGKIGVVVTFSWAARGLRSLLSTGLPNSMTSLLSIHSRHGVRAAG